MSIDIPSREDLADLTQHRQAGSISLYVSTNAGNGSRAAIVHDPEAARIALRSALGDALRELEQLDVPAAERDRLLQECEVLDRDRAFWSTAARTIAIFLAPGDWTLRSYRLMNELPVHTAIGDRFDVGPLVRATTFAHSGYVLAVTEGEVRLIALDSDNSHRSIELQLPEEATNALIPVATDGRLDRHRADGTLGPKVEYRRYCSGVQDAMLEAIGDDHRPLVLAASAELEPAYREVSSYRQLLHTGIDANPASLGVEQLVARGRAILGRHYADRIAAWREDFGAKRANGRASAQLSEIARAATAGLVDTLLFDLESTEEGSIDEAGAVTIADRPGPQTYGLADELVARVLRTGGTVKAVRREDLPDVSPVAATFRGAL